MEKETLLSGFKTVIGDPDAVGNYKDLGVTQRTLDTYLDALAPTITGDTVDDAFYAKHVAVLKAMGGQLRHEQAEFVKNYKPKSDPDKITGKEAIADEVLRELRDSIKTLTDENKAMRGRLDDMGKDAERRRKYSEVMSLMRERGADDEYVLSATMRGVEIDTSKDVEELTTEYLKLYDKELKDCRGDGVLPREPGNGGKSKTAVDAYFEAKFKSENK